MGGMAAQIPIRGGGAEADKALASVRADKLREAQAGHDGTWIAHPGLLKVALEAFDAHMPTPNQIHVIPAQADAITASDLLRAPTQGSVTLAGLRDNVNVLLEYTRAWLAGVGCIPLHNKMEDGESIRQGHQKRVVCGGGVVPFPITQPSPSPQHDIQPPRRKFRGCRCTSGCAMAP